MEPTPKATAATTAAPRVDGVEAHGALKGHIEAANLYGSPSVAGQFRFRPPVPLQTDSWWCLARTCRCFPILCLCCLPPPFSFLCSVRHSTGPEAYRSLLGRCVVVREGAYEYRVCPFRNVTQCDVITSWSPFQGILGMLVLAATCTAGRVPLFPATVSRHCFPPLFSATVSRHCFPPLFPAIVFRHCFPLPPAHTRHIRVLPHNRLHSLIVHPNAPACARTHPHALATAGKFTTFRGCA